MNKTDIKEQKYSRYEFKYILDPVMYQEVRGFIDDVGLSADEHAPRQPYIVTSLYFDTFGLDDYYDKAGGFLNRKKLRVRIYGHDLEDNITDVHLEIKNKHNMFVSKERISVPVKEWRKFVAGDSQSLFSTFNYFLFDEGRVPKIVVRYEREAFEETFPSRVRITFDRNVEVLVGESLEYTEENWHDTIPVSDISTDTIMEIKFSEALPWWFGLMMKKYDLRRTAYSKYAESIDRMYQYNPLPR